MKKNILLATMISALGLTYSCDNQTKENNDQHPIEKMETIKEHPHSNKTGLELNDGKLWLANPETTTGVENMVKIMDSFTEKDNVQAYEKLRESLKMEFSMIFQKCTMTGEAHNQLHHFLIPIKTALGTLSSSDLKQNQDTYNQLNTHLKEYKKYFKS